MVEHLSPRETEILRLLASGMTSDAIAEPLNLSQKTIRNHHYAIKSKIGAKNDAHLVWLAVRAGLVSITDSARRSAGASGGCLRFKRPCGRNLCSAPSGGQNIS